MESNNLRILLLKEKQKYRTLFKKNYTQNVLPIFKNYEKHRISELNKFLKIIILSSIFLSIGIISAFNCHSVLQQMLTNTVILASLCGLIGAPFISYLFSGEIKYECMQKLIDALTDINWHTNYIDKSYLTKSKLFPIFCDKTSDDSFNGVHNGVNYIIDEMSLNGEAGFNVFKGVVILFDCNKNIANKTIIADKSNIQLKFKDTMLYLFYGILSVIFILLGIATFFTQDIQIIFVGLWCFGFCTWLIYEFCKLIKKNSSNLSGVENLSRMTLEDIKFESKYTAYSSNQVEGRYLITTAFMERFQNLQQAFKTSKVKCSFFDDKIMFAISTNRNMFEIGSLFTPLTDFKTIEVFFDEIIAIFVMIDYLKLKL